MPLKQRRTPTAEAQVRSFIAKLDPKTQKLTRSVRTAVRKRFPTANELAYDYGHAFVIGYSPTENGIDAIVALSARADGVFLYFNQGPKLSDPKRLLQGSGKQTRFVQIASASALEDPDIGAFIAATVDQAKIPFPSKGEGTLMIKSSAQKKKRPSRKATK